MPDLMDFDDAVQRTADLPAATPVTERVALSTASGRILASPIHADRDLPPFHRACMDGYAYAAGEEAAMPVDGEVAAGEASDRRIPAGACALISTGAPLPPGTDTVIPHEQTDRGNPLRVTGVWPGRGSNVHARAADAAEGDTLVERGTRIGPAEIGIAAMVGAAEIQVLQRPRVAVFTSGNEVVAEGVLPASHQIRNSNGPMVESLIERLGGSTVAAQHLPDDSEASVAAIRAKLDQSSIIVTTGGISAGRHDHVGTSLESIGVTWAVNGVAMQPGKPVRVGTIGATSIVCLPGNPVSALITGSIFLATAMRLHLGLPAMPRWRPVALREDAKANPRRSLLRPAVTTSAMEASIPPWQGSGDLAHAAGTRGVVRLPRTGDCAAGTVVPFTRWP